MLRLLPLILLLPMHFEVQASAKDGEATVYVGESTTISIGSPYQRTLNQATGISYQWRSNTSNIVITSSTRNYAKIKGVGATTSGKVYYYCSYYIDGFYRTMDFYYDVVVKNSTVYVTSISLNYSEATITEGNTLSLNATVYPSNATNRSVTWSSNRSSVATVSSSGTVTGISSGTATITCRANDGSGKYATCYISVEPVAPTSVSIPSTLTLKKGETSTLTPTLYPSGTSTTYSWSSNNTGVVTVNSSGKVTAVEAGTARITVRTANSLSDYCDVTVISEPESISLTEDNIILGMYKNHQLTSIITPSNAETSLLWSSNNTEVATVNNNGLISAVGVGETDITVKTSNGLKATCHVTVPEPEYAFVLWTFSGEQIVYSFVERPKVTQTGESLIVNTANTVIEYAKTDVWKFTLADLSVDVGIGGIDEILKDKVGEISQQGNTLILSGFNADSDVRVFTVSGQVVKADRINDDGTLIIDMSQLNTGIYIVSTECITYKIIKR